MPRHAHFAVLIGVGATTVNAYLAGGHRRSPSRGLFGDLAIDSSCALSHGGRRGLAEDHVQDGHLGDLVSYRGGYNFEAVGLSRALVASSSPACQPHLRHRLCLGIAPRSEARRRPGQRRAALPVGGFYRQRAAARRTPIPRS
jgi:glutamate synthase (NADPH/NADH) large chain